ncbi:MAG: FtsW/RodA/SpoVE family cell cycle protein [Planctomycetota bacterium]
MLADLLYRDDSSAVGTLIRGSARRESIRESLRLLNPAWLSILAAMALSLIGIAAIDLGTNEPTAGAMDLSSLAWKQVVFLNIGVMAAVVIGLAHFRLPSAFAWFFYAVGIGLLIFLLVPGVPTALVRPRNGTRGWIDLGPLDFQPAEAMKVAYVLAVARYMRWRSTHRKLSGLIVPFLFTVPPVLLIAAQPDLGTAGLFVPALFAMLIAAGAKMRHIGLIVLVGVMLAPASWPVLRPHQKTRIIGLVKQFENDRSTAQDINFQAFTAQALIGSGGAGGTDDRAARSLVRYNALPERHNDMIFAVITLRWGLLGGMAVLAAYLAWIAGALLTAAITIEPQGRLICVGMAAFVSMQAVVNIGMNLGVLPIIGITLPFISYGGASLATMWLMTALVLSVGLHPARPPFRQSFEYGDDDG